MDIRRGKLIKASTSLSINRLLDKAREERKSKKPDYEERSKKYVKMAFELLKKNKVRLPKEIKNSFCRKCFVIWVPGDTVLVWYDKKEHCIRLTCRCGFSKRV